MSSVPADQTSATAAQSANEARLASERAGQRLTLVLFAGIFALAIIGLTVSAIANSIMRHGNHSTMINTTTTAAPTQQISLDVRPGWKPGPKGERYDAFSKTNFAVNVGRPVRLTIDNEDTAVHSITAPEVGVSIVVMPGVHTYMLLVRRAGRFKWICAYPCDPFSMAHVGYMQGYIIAT